MNNYIPGMYKKDIFDVDYDKLRKKKIKCLMFDLDNTLIEAHKTKLKPETCELIKKLKINFDVFIVSNNTSKKRLSTIADKLNIKFVRISMKPLARGFKKVQRENNYKKEEMCIIGDQLMTDVLGGNKYGIYTVLIDPITEKEAKITGFNRFLEKRKLKKLEKKGLFKKGDYYG